MTDPITARFNGGFMDGQMLTLDYAMHEVAFPICTRGFIESVIYKKGKKMNDGAIEYVYIPSFAELFKESVTNG